MKIEITTTLPDEILTLLTFAGFHAHYLKLWQSGNTQIVAYRLTEEIHIKYFKYQKYSSFNSFRQVMKKKLG